MGVPCYHWLLVCFYSVSSDVPQIKVFYIVVTDGNVPSPLGGFYL
jgi:hypothetical protein